MMGLRMKKSTKPCVPRVCPGGRQVMKFVRCTSVHETRGGPSLSRRTTARGRTMRKTSRSMSR